MTKTARLVKPLDGFEGHASLYRLSPPIAYGAHEQEQQATKYVVVSDASILGEPETHILPADQAGACLATQRRVLKGRMGHGNALQRCGYFLTVAASIGANLPEALPPFEPVEGPGIGGGTAEAGKAPRAAVNAPEGTKAPVARRARTTAKGGRA